MVVKYDWTHERIEELKKLWDEGYSGSQIRLLMKAPTRNVIMGKIHRLGIQRRIPPLVKRVVDIEDVKPEPLPPPPPPPPKAKLPPVSLDKLGSRQCRWPFGDGPFLFCGDHAQFGKPYCEEHQAIAWKKVS